MISKTDLTEEEKYDFGERSGIYEFDANIPRPEAERLALIDIENRRKRKE